MSKYRNGFTCGAFDLLHPGHVHFIQECRRQCNLLIVGLHTDPTIDRPGSKNKPVQTMFERYLQLDGLSCVDLIVPYDTERDLANMMATLDIQVRFVGTDYMNMNKQITGANICTTRGIEVFYIDRLHNFSSTDLRERIKQ
jgi:glycerol-3-phosphate cytidylyltransferase